jgi:hypothetical protein
MRNMDSKEEAIMKDPQPSVEEWHALYRAAVDFQQIQPWRWVNDTDLFGVKNPEDGEIGYCCVVGALGEFLGLDAIKGTFMRGVPSRSDILT